MQANISNNSFLKTASLNGPRSKGVREQAIENGALIDVTGAAVPVGFTIPVGMTRRVWNEMVVWTSEDSRRQVPQDMTARLWNVIWTLRCHSQVKRHKPTRELMFYVHCVPWDGQSRLPRAIPLKAEIQRGDVGEAVITIMMPDEE